MLNISASDLHINTHSHVREKMYIFKTKIYKIMWTAIMDPLSINCLFCCIILFIILHQFPLRFSARTACISLCCSSYVQWLWIKEYVENVCSINIILSSDMLKKDRGDLRNYFLCKGLIRSQTFILPSLMI